MNVNLRKILQLSTLILCVVIAKTAVSQVIQKVSSPLEKGVWRKLSVKQDGVYKITGKEIKQWGWDITNINSKTFKLYGNHGGMMEEQNNISRSYNLDEIAIKVEDGGDGILNENDYIIFWGEGPHKWKRNANGYYHETNLYSEQTIYFFTFGGADGKRLSIVNSSGKNPDVSFSTYDYLTFYEKEEHKIYHSGKAYHGDRYLETGTKSYVINVPNPAVGIAASLKIAFAGEGPSSSVQYIFNGQSLATIAGLYGSDDATSIRYTQSETQYGINSYSSNNSLLINYTKNGNKSIGYLDYFEFKGKSNLVLSNQLLMHQGDAVGVATTELLMQNGGKNYTLWDVANPWNTRVMNGVVNGNQTKLVVENNGAAIKLVSFDGSSFLTVNDLGAQTNQNIAGINPPDLVIITHPAFFAAANKLASHRRENDGLEVLVTDPQTIYNEFSSGIQDITAIRDFMRYLFYQDNSKLKYLLILGDASYDYKDRIEGNTNYVPTYESLESRSEVSSYCSDDYYGFLDDNDGTWISSQRLEISIGRLPVASVEEANRIVDKVIRYDSPKSFGKWRLGINFLADDIDERWDSAHLDHSEQLSTSNEAIHPLYNNSKIYADAYKEVLLGGAGAYPEASREIDEVMNKGTLVFNYIGHGGVLGMAKERLVTVDQIDKWKNMYKMPVFITATCALSAYDDPQLKSAGEHMICNPEGGPAALLTTTRLVYSGPNFSLNKGVWIDNILSNNADDRLGDIYLRTKNRADINDNDRRFTLLGDPSMRLAKPKHKIIIDTINGNKASQFDTLKALSSVTIKGHLEKRSGGAWNDFNGTVDVVIYDKPLDEKTLANGAQSFSMEYKHLKSIIYNGSVKAINGRYEITFIVPKDINYNTGLGKISLYAHNNIEDAAGYKNDIIIGEANPNPDPDNEGPEVKLYLNDRNFVNGGYTNSSPLFIVDVYDDHGINLSSSGIGRNLVLIIDRGTADEKQIVVNDFYTSAIGTYKKGEIQYQLSDLTPGSHSLHLKVWDTYNNSSEAGIQFIVGKKTNQFEIYTIRTIPNPFSNSPQVIIDHNRPNTDIIINSQLFDMTGKQVFSNTQTLYNTSAHIEFILNEDENWIAALKSGMYILRCTLSTSNGETKTYTQRIIYTQK